MELLVRRARIALLLAAAWPAMAAADPLELRAVAGVIHDSNVFRLPGNVAAPNGRDDTILQAQAGARGEANVSLQQFVIDASVTRYSFQDHKNLSFTGVAANGAWNWQVGSRFSGTAAYDYQRRQTSFNEFRQTTGQNIVTVRQPSFEARYRPGNALFAYGGYRHLRGTNSAAILKVADYRSDVFSGGAGYALRNGGELRLGVKRTDTDFTSNQLVRIRGVLLPVRNDFRLDEVEGNLSYPIGPKTLLSGRVAYTDRKVADVAGRDFSGVTGRLVLAYRPTALLSFLISPRRELTGADDIQTNFVTTDAVNGSIEYRPRPYVTIRADAESTKRDYEGFAVAAPTTGRIDRGRSYGLSASYAWPLGSRFDLAVRRERRNSTIASLDFNATTLTAALALVF